MGILFLIGPRASGKTLAAALLAKEYACPCCDTDQLVVAAAGKSVAEIVAEEGWPAFRAAEKAALVEAVARMGAAPATTGVVATGGGIVLDPENRAFMRASGVVAYLTTSPDELIGRLLRSRDKSSRPPLSGLSFEDEVRSVMAEREPLYRETAHHMIDASLPPVRVARLLHDITVRSFKGKS